MTAFGVALYLLVVRLLTASVNPFLPDRSTHNDVGRLPYCAACLFSCVAGTFDPLGLKLRLASMILAAFGGSSGLMLGGQSAAQYDHNRAQASDASGDRMVDAAAVIGILYITSPRPRLRF